MKKLIALVVLASILFVQACNTVQGIGKDLEATAKALQKDYQE